MAVATVRTATMPLLMLLLLLALDGVLEFVACVCTADCADDAVAHLVAAICAECTTGKGAEEASFAFHGEGLVGVGSGKGACGREVGVCSDFLGWDGKGRLTVLGLVLGILVVALARGVICIGELLV